MAYPPIGQTLIVTAGSGLAQCWGGPIEEIRPGDVIWIPPEEKHWHGATPTTAMMHIAIQEQFDGKAVDWKEKVSDEQYRAEQFIGRWMTEGETVPQSDASAVPIVASDIYQWLPGEHFVMHPAYGRIGEVGVGGLEVIGFDPATGQYQCHFFDSQRNTTTQTLSCRDDAWTWQGTYARCTGVFTDDGKTLTARHERSDDGERWMPSMTVTLRRVE